MTVYGEFQIFTSKGNFFSAIKLGLIASPKIVVLKFSLKILSLSMHSCMHARASLFTFTEKATAAATAAATGAAAAATATATAAA